MSLEVLNPETWEWRQIDHGPAPEGFVPARRRRYFIAYWHLIGWEHLSLGFHVHVGEPNIELHLPFGFVRLGWHRVVVPDPEPRTTLRERWEFSRTVGLVLPEHAR